MRRDPDVYRCATNAELFRLRRLRSTSWTLFVSLALVLVVAVAKLGATPAGATGQRVLRDANAAVDVVPILVGFAVLIFVVGEFGQGSIGATLAMIPARRVVIAAKVTAGVIATLAFAVAGVTVTTTVVAVRQFVVSGSLIGPGAWGRSAVTMVVVLLSYSVLAAALALLTCRSVSAVVAYLLVLFLLPVAATVLGIWLPALGGTLVDFSPVTMTVQIVDGNPGWVAVGRFAVLDTTLLACGIVRAARVRVR